MHNKWHRIHHGTSLIRKRVDYKNKRREETRGEGDEMKGKVRDGKGRETKGREEKRREET
jgi:hypothetical protein